MIRFLSQDFPFFIKLKRAIKVPIVLSSLSFLFVLFIGPILVQSGQKNSSLAFIMLFMVFNSQLLFRLLIPLFFKNQFSEKKWTVGKEIIWLFLEIAVGIFFCYMLLHWLWNVPDGLYLQNTIRNITRVFIGLQLVAVPLAIYIKREMVLQTYLKRATYLNMFLIKKKVVDQKNTLGHTVILKSNDENQNIELQASDILFLKAAQNYVEVFYVSDHQVKRILLRNTLKSLFQDLKDSKVFIFCHRSYVLNIQQVATINGNSRGYKVLLRHYNEPIPVSRQKAQEFEEAIRKVGI